MSRWTPEQAWIRYAHGHTSWCARVDADSCDCGWAELHVFFLEKHAQSPVDEGKDSAELEKLSQPPSATIDAVLEAVKAEMHAYITNGGLQRKVFMIHGDVDWFVTAVRQRLAQPQVEAQVHRKPYDIAREAIDLFLEIRDDSTSGDEGLAKALTLQEFAEAETADIPTPAQPAPTVAVRVEDLKKDEWSGETNASCCTVCEVAEGQLHKSNCWKGNALKAGGAA